MLVDAEFVLALEIGHRQVLRVDVLSACNRLARHADDLVVALTGSPAAMSRVAILCPGGISPATTRSSDAMRAPESN